MEPQAFFFCSHPYKIMGAYATLASILNQECKVEHYKVHAKVIHYTRLPTATAVVSAIITNIRI